jgi:two-component system, cell cycle response regulator
MVNKSSILIVDDEDRGRDALEMLLLTENYDLLFAASGKEALQKAEESTPDLILLDVMMPGMDGFEVCQRLRSHPRLAEVPVIMITALDDPESRLHGINVGADDFITKPFDRSELRTRVRTITRLNRYRRLLLERSRFEWVVDRSNEGYLLLEGTDQLVYANPTARRYLGICQNDTLPLSFNHCLTAARYQKEPTLAWENWPADNLKDNVRYLVRPETKDHPPLWLEVNIFDYPSDHSHLVHLRNVSEHINLQRQVWTFQTLVSHKLRGPLNGLVSLQMLDSPHVDLSSERAVSLLKIAKESAKRLQDQVLEILRYIDTTRLRTLQANFRLADLPELLIRLQWDLSLEPIHLELPESLLKQVLTCSPEAIELILRELLNNAKKFHPKHSPDISLSVSLCKHDPNQVKLAVRDNGRCLSNEELERVWMPYYQSEKSFTGEIKGMGLGLAMVARLVWNSGGHCEIHNCVDHEGIEVVVALPATIETLPFKPI